MDPIKTAVRYALIPLRIAVQLGDLYVAGDQPEPRSGPQPDRSTRDEPRGAAPRKRARRPTADPQASQVPKDLDDVALARKVETIIFRDPAVPKGAIDVNAASGVVWLRGEARTPDMIRGLEAQARGIPEVRDVENLLHLPKTPSRRPNPRLRTVATGSTLGDR